jgi:AcrR family transcriptional regulator
MAEARPVRAPRGSRSAPAPPPPREFRQARARATYEKILGAALELYAERGYHATQTPDIAARAGLSVGGLYRYFRDKHQIFVEVMHHGLEHNRRQQDAMIAAFEEAWRAGEVDLPEAAERIVDWTWDAVRGAPPDLLRTYMAMGYQDETFSALREQYDRYERQAMARLLEKLWPAGRRSSPLAAAKVIDIVVETLAMWAATHSGAESRGVKQATKELVARYLSAD